MNLRVCMHARGREPRRHPPDISCIVHGQVGSRDGSLDLHISSARESSSERNMLLLGASHFRTCDELCPLYMQLDALDVDGAY